MGAGLLAGLMGLLVTTSSVCLVVDARAVDAAPGQDQAQPAPQQPQSQPQPQANNGAMVDELRFRIGDRITLAFYERREAEEDKWGPADKRPQQPSHSFLQRAELSGERLVQEDGAIVFPFLGKFSVAGVTSHDLEAALTSAFQREFGRRALVNILSVEHSPVYIVGPVRNAGSFKYVPGMTVLHLVALAGGVERSGSDAWSNLESVRETQRAHRSVEILARSLARDAVLHAERDSRPVETPQRLIQLVGAAQAKTIVNDEFALRSLTVSTNAVRKTSLKAAVESAKGELEALQGRLAPLNAEIKLRSEHANAVGSLNEKGVLSRPALLQAQSELSGIEARRQEVLASIALARRRLDQAIEEENRFGIDARTALEHDIVTTNREIADNTDTIMTALGGAGAMETSMTGASTFSYEIVRRTAKGVETIAVSDISEVEPGDIVRMTRSTPAAQAGILSRLYADKASVVEAARLQK